MHHLVTSPPCKWENPSSVLRTHVKQTNKPTKSLPEEGCWFCNPGAERQADPWGSWASQPSSLKEFQAPEQSPLKNQDERGWKDSPAVKGLSRAVLCCDAHELEDAHMHTNKKIKLNLEKIFRKIRNSP